MRKIHSRRLLMKILRSLLFIWVIFWAPFLGNEIQSATYEREYRQLVWFYKPSFDTTPRILAKYFENFILTKGDESYRDILKAEGVTSPFLQYLRLDAIQDPGSCSVEPYHNQVADMPGDFCNISSNHPDWFLLDKNGRRMYSDGYVMMDPGNSDWRRFFLNRAMLSQTALNWDGVFLDNAEASLTKRYQYGQVPAKYKTDSSYQNAVKGLLSYLYINYFQPAGHPLFANIITLKNPSIWFSFLQVLDGAMSESWGTDWDSKWLPAAEWRQQLNRAENTQGLGKRVILVAQGDKTDLQRQQFAYASFLLIDNGRAFFRYTLKDHYRHAWKYENYNHNLGIPLGRRYQKGNQWCRDYSSGKVCVDPSSHNSVILTKQ